MIHVATVHHHSDRWIDIQLGYFARAMNEPYRVVANCEGVDPARTTGFDVVVPAMGPHPGKLNHLAAVIARDAAPDDVLMFIDGDAFPIVDPMPAVRRALDENPLVAVRRDENVGDPQPHPCFCATTVGFWESLHGDWSRGYTWVNTFGETVTDTGANMLYLLERADAAWTPLLRSNRVDLHPLFFAVYGDIVYHHGAGFRRIRSRRDRAEAGRPRVQASTSFGRFLQSGRRLWADRGERDRNELSKRLYDQILADPEFYRQFL